MTTPDADLREQVVLLSNHADHARQYMNKYSSIYTDIYKNNKTVYFLSQISHHSCQRGVALSVNYISHGYQRDQAKDLRQVLAEEFSEWPAFIIVSQLLAS